MYRNVGLLNSANHATPKAQNPAKIPADGGDKLISIKVRRTLTLEINPSLCEEYKLNPKYLPVYREKALSVKP